MKVNIKHINNLHSDAIRGLEFYRQELDILQKRLEEIAADNTSEEVAEEVEYFQNEFIIHDEQIDELKHAFHENINSLEKQLVHSAGFANLVSLEENSKLYDQYITEEKMFNELRHVFNRFVAKWL